MENGTFWKSHYVIRADEHKIERRIRATRFASGGRDFELIYFEDDRAAPNILISQGSGGHPYVFAELAYLMHLNGYNVFVMPKHGDGFTIDGLVQRHRDAAKHISSIFNDRLGIFSEGLGGYAAFYLALAHGPLRSLVCENAPAIVTEKRFAEAVIKGDGAYMPMGRKLRLFKAFARLLPTVRIPISSYLDWEELVDPKEENRDLERRLVLEGYLKDPDFDKRYRLSSVVSQISTPPPNPIAELAIPTMFLVAARGVFPSYTRDLYDRLPAIKKRIVDVDGSVYWMLSHPNEAAKLVCEWFGETLAAT